jgi:hypothetical protein
VGIEEGREKISWACFEKSNFYHLLL